MAKEGEDYYRDQNRDSYVVYSLLKEKKYKALFFS